MKEDLVHKLTRGKRPGWVVLILITVGIFTVMREKEIAAFIITLISRPVRAEELKLLIVVCDGKPLGSAIIQFTQRGEERHVNSDGGVSVPRDRCGDCILIRDDKTMEILLLTNITHTSTPDVLDVKSPKIPSS